MSSIRYLFAGRQFSDLNPIRAGEETNAAGRHVGPTVRHETVLHYVLQGKGVYYARGGIYPVEAGQAFLILPDEIVSYTADSADPWHYQWIVFNGKLSESFRQLPPVFALSPKHFRNIFSHMEDTATWEYKIAAQLFLLYAELFSKERHNNDYVKRVKSYIQVAYMEPITVVQNLADFTGEKKLSEALMQKDNVTAYFNTVVTGYDTENGALCGLQLRNEVTGEESAIRVDGAFLAVGLMPENEPFAEHAALNNWGYFDSGEDCRTKTEGIFVAGDCRSKHIRQVVNASADGAIAAMAACRYLD